jgi:lysophospholipase L1-like esterase
MIALIAAGLIQAMASPPCTAALCDAERLRPVAGRLARARGTGEPVRIVQIGDSHTAGDQITGSWRTLLQARYGSGGRGVLPPGRPYAGYLTRGVTAGQSDGWSVNGIFGAAYRGAGAPPVGVSGYSLTNTRPGAAITIAGDGPAQMFDRFTVCALERPGAGTLTLSAGAVVQSWPLAATRDGGTCRTIDLDAPVSAASVSVAAGTATVTSWSTERRGRGGVILSNLGTVGAQFVHTARTDDAVVANELRTYAPDLIVLAFGTNEAFWPGFTAAGYDATLRANVARVRRLAPGVPILLLGAPDSATRTPSLMTLGGIASPACGAAPVDTAAPVVVRPGEIVQPLPADASATASSGWRPTGALASVQAIQRRVAHDLGLAYWDWSRAMGGRCTAHRWVTDPTPLMRGDHVHFTSRGGAAIAQALQADLDGALSAPSALRVPAVH